MGIVMGQKHHGTYEKIKSLKSLIRVKCAIWCLIVLIAKPVASFRICRHGS